MSEAKNELQNEKATTPNIDMDDSTSDLIIDEVEQTETFESSQRLIATPKRCMTSTFVERQSEKITPKMREGRAIIEGKSENLKPLERITAGGSEAPPRWQCNMCKRIFQQEWKQ